MTVYTEKFTPPLALADRGALDLEVDISAYLTSWQVPENEFSKGADINLFALLSHTAGFRKGRTGEYEYDTPLPTLLQVLNGEPPSPHPPVTLIARPGAGWLYSNAGFYIIQQVLEDRFRKPFPEIVAETLLQPLGMSQSVYMQRLTPELEANAAFGHEDDGSLMKGRYHVFPAFGSGTGLWTTPTDLARLVVEIQKAVAGRPNHLFSRATAELMLTPVMESYGLGTYLDLEGEPVFYHAGGTVGFRSQLTAFHYTGQGVVIMTNGMGGATLKDEVVRSVAEVYDWPAYRCEEKRAIFLEPAALENFAGPFLCSGFPSLVLRVMDDRLVSSFFTHPGAELIAETPTRFFLRDQWVSYEFRLNESGVPVEMTLDLQGSPHAFHPAHAGHPELARIFNLSERRPSLTSGELEDAVAILRRLRDEGHPAAGEGRLNTLGYMLKRASMPAALAVLRINTLLYPNSANTYDSLAEVSLEAGDKDSAIDCYRRVLEVLDRDEVAGVELKARLRENAEVKLRELGHS